MAPSGLDEVARVVQEVMAVEGSKGSKLQVTSQMKIAKSNAVSGMDEAFPFENNLQLEFKPEMRFETVNFFPTRYNPLPIRGPSDLRNQFRCVCVCLLGGIYDLCLYFPALCLVFCNWCLRDTVSRPHSYEFMLTSVKSQPEMEYLI